MNVYFGKNPLPIVSTLENVKVLKILGVFFNDRGLTWSEHLAFICKKASRRLYVLRILKPLFSHDQLVKVFYALIRSLFEYACPLFLNPGVSFDMKLKSLCKRVFVIIHGRDCTTCNSCDLLNIQYRRELLSMRLFKDALNNTLHSLHPILPRRSDRPPGRLLIPYARCQRRAKTFVPSCAILYNSAS